MKVVIKEGFYGNTYDLRIEENGHSASNAGGCNCWECQTFRSADGRCTECGTDQMKHSCDGRCVRCTASGLGA